MRTKVMCERFGIHQTYASFKMRKLMAFPRQQKLEYIK